MVIRLSVVVVGCSELAWPNRKGLPALHTMKLDYRELLLAIAIAIKSNQVKPPHPGLKSRYFMDSCTITTCLRSPIQPTDALLSGHTVVPTSL